MAVKLDLPSRYEVRVLEEKHIGWAAAIVIHSNMFYSPIWPVLYPDNQTKRAYDGLKYSDYLVRHQIDSGYSLGVFDKEYQYKNPESAATEGKLWWDVTDESVDQDKLLEQMDFPLVSIALAYDSINALDMTRMADLVAVMPAFGTLYGVLGAEDKRDPATWKATGPNEVIFRNATSTRREYEGKGIMKALAQYMMRTVSAKGFRGIQIECAADAVSHVWGKPPAPFHSDIVCEFECLTYEMEDDQGNKTKPFAPADQRVTKIYCDVKA